MAVGRVAPLSFPFRVSLKAEELWEVDVFFNINADMVGRYIIYPKYISKYQSSLVDIFFPKSTWSTFGDRNLYCIALNVYFFLLGILVYGNLCIILFSHSLRYTSGPYIMSEYHVPWFESSNASFAILRFDRSHGRILIHKTWYSNRI